jgi:DNA-binding MarR family transcriptional regulator
MTQEQIDMLNSEITDCLQLSRQDLVEHIRNLEAQLKTIERSRRAANMAKRIKDESLTEEERLARAAESENYLVEPKAPRHPRKSPEEIAKNRKPGVSRYAALLKTTKEQIMLMDDDEFELKVARLKAARKAHDENNKSA